MSAIDDRSLKNEGPSKNEVMSIGELAARTGLTTSAIRFYESKGLIVAARSNSGQRRFMRADIRRLSLILVAQEFGFTLPEIREYLKNIPSGRALSKQDWARLSKEFKQHLEQRIERMTLLRDRLDSCIGCGCLSMEQCHLYNAGDAAAKYGRGPRYLYGDKVLKPQKEA
ncbi:redox-sensitive transcriptional activator SoxR [Polycladidibacter stylochi]|uniref:redox-sensitive transcriptional activator SoxR n=1 Tax=Polycladidibacter stylochi TaxID=1807766 RepID=UPI000830EB8E|nr:redox-sensitive transcriptional activator SoxR [Pseudovibrio stylochi]